MKQIRIIAILTLVRALCLADGITVTQVVDRARGFSAVIATVPAGENGGFSLIDVPFRREGDSIRSYWEPSKDVIVINGGYFNPDFSPTGFCRINGRSISGSRSKTLSGFAAIDVAGKLHILTRQDKLEQYPTVLQTGPYVIDPGGRIGIYSKSGRQARRTLIGLTKANDIVVMVTEPIYLLDLARYVNKRFPSIERLLNLDGGPSTALMTDGHAVVNRWPVRNYLKKRRTTQAR